MFRLPILLFALLAILPGLGQAQTIAEPHWDFTVTTGLFAGRPGDGGQGYYGDDSYTAARVGISAGRYWTNNLKTEVEVMTSGEGTRHTQRMVMLPDGGWWPYGAQEYFRLSQGSARVVWQLFDNQWIHPYLLAGVVVDAERQRADIAEQYYFTGDARVPGSRQRLAPQRTEGPETVLRGGLMTGAGAKLYMSSRAFANTALLVTHAKPARTVSFILGLGLDF